jgi:glucose/arabinose dehydrogenase
MLGAIGITVIPPGGEQGLLNLEFHPNYANNGYVFFYHTLVASDTNSISRATLSFDGSGNMVLDDAIKIIDFKKNTSASNHNGGGMVFAPDGSLLASVGDGGSGGASNGQLNTNLLGVVARINPSLITAVGGYSIPTSGNMFAATNTQCSGVATSATPCPEILAMGLRNPFRMSMAGNIVYLGDVGSAVEEINSFDYTAVDTSNPANFGWNTHDGFVSSSSIPGYRNPIVYYSRNDSTANAFRTEDPEGNPTGSASIMIGDIYGGLRYGGELDNKLFFAEFYDGFMRAVGVDSNGDITDTDGVPGLHIIHHGQISSMVEGPDGYIYFTTLYGPDMVYRLVKP